MVIGEISQRCIAKGNLVGSGAEVKGAYGCFQLCAGLEAGIEGALHTVCLQDTLLTKPRSPSEHCVWSRQISVDSQLPLVRLQGRLRMSQVKNFKIQDFAHRKDIG